MPRFLHLLLLPILLLFSESCAFRSIKRSKHLVYRQPSAQFQAQELNVFAPRRAAGDAPVLVFFHGGNWRSGRKELYSWFGSRLARKGIVAVVIDYPLSPAADFAAQARYAALSVAWIEQHIGTYGGNANRVFLSGHSSGGHLAALLGTDPSWLREAGAVNVPQGLVLIDAAGLNMDGYLRAGGLDDDPSYPATFGTDTSAWCSATPLLHLHEGMPPMLLLSGGRSYPSIVSSYDTFARRLQAGGYSHRLILQPRRKHVPMITQFFNSGNPRYRDILHFLNSGRP